VAREAGVGLTQSENGKTGIQLVAREAGVGPTQSENGKT
jgi:hypothetical protein